MAKRTTAEVRKLVNDLMDRMDKSDDPGQLILDEIQKELDSMKPEPNTRKLVISVEYTDQPGGFVGMTTSIDGDGLSTQDIVEAVRTLETQALPELLADLRGKCECPECKAAQN